MKQRGIFEKDPGSKVWWVCYYDQFGKKRREKAGTKGVTIKLHRKRKQQVLEGKKLPELFRKRPSISINWPTTHWLIQRGTSGRTRPTFRALPNSRNGLVRSLRTNRP